MWTEALSGENYDQTTERRQARSFHECAGCRHLSSPAYAQSYAPDSIAIHSSRIMKTFIVELIYGREVRIKADKCEKEGDRHVFYTNAGTRVDDVLSEIVSGIHSEEDHAPTPSAGFSKKPLRSKYSIHELSSFTSTGSFAGKTEVIWLLVVGIVSLAAFITSRIEAFPLTVVFTSEAVACVFALPFGLIAIAAIFSAMVQLFTPGGGNAIALFVWDGGVARLALRLPRKTVMAHG